jgi:hypothetical protein
MEPRDVPGAAADVADEDELGSFRFPFRSSLNHNRKVVSRLARCRVRPDCCFPAVMLGAEDDGEMNGSPVTLGELAGVGAPRRMLFGGLTCCASVNTHGDPTCVCWLSDGGVDGAVVAALLLFPCPWPDFVSLDDELPYELLGSSPLAILSLSLSRSFSSRTPSDDFFRTKPAASNAVVALCMMLTLPDRTLPSLSRPFPHTPSALSRKLPDGVDGCERDEDPAAVGVGDGDKCVCVGERELGGVTGGEKVGVAGTSASWGADRVALSAWVWVPTMSVCTDTDTAVRLPLLTAVDGRVFDGLRGPVSLAAVPAVAAAGGGEAGSESGVPFSLSPASARAFFSALRLSIHHSAPAASHASLKTECTIWAVSKPRALRLVSRFLSSGVEKMMGAGVLRRVAKS